MKKIIYSFVIGLSVATMISCKKKDTDTATPTPVSIPQTKADDTGARNELQNAYDDIEDVYNSQDYANASGMRTTGSILPCGNVSINTKNFTIQYNGVNCGMRVLSGSIDVTLISTGDTTFSYKNARLKAVFNNYKVLYTNSKQSVTYNGTTYITNITGGTLLTLFSNTPNAEVIHSVRGQLSLTFDTLGTSAFIRSWNVFHKKTFQNTPGTETGITLKLEGDTSLATYISGTYNSVSEYGLNVDNDKFVCNITNPFIWSNCGKDYSGPYILKEGKVDYTSFTSKPAAGYTKAMWSATAGYKYDATNKYVLDGSCSSNGYKVDISLVNPTTNAVGYSSSSFIAY